MSTDRERVPVQEREWRTAAGRMHVKRFSLAFGALSLALATALAAGCRDHECARYYMPANKIQPLLSPGSGFVLTVPHVADSTGNTYWRVTIADSSGAVVYVDTESDFVGNLNVYWIWDADGRVWLYNSDDGTVHFYTDESGSWEHVIYGPAGHPSSEGMPDPPDGLLPGYLDETGQ